MCMWMDLTGGWALLLLRVINVCFSGVKLKEEEENITCLQIASVMSSKCPEAPAVQFDSKRQCYHHVFG